MPRDGRPTIFRSPGEKVRYQGLVSAVGAQLFEKARARVALLVKTNTDAVSDGAVMEYLARGDRASRAYLKSTRK
jgi:hypothetical protein